MGVGGVGLGRGLPRRRGADSAAASTRASAEIAARSPTEIVEALRPAR